jgi:hypothetical protein
MGTVPEPISMSVVDTAAAAPLAAFGVSAWTISWCWSPLISP